MALYIFVLKTNKHESTFLTSSVELFLFSFIFEAVLDFTKQITNFSKMEVIEHYKKKLLRHIEDPDTVLYCLKKLNAVPVTIDILQESEVGKVVNRLKKRTDTTPDVITSSKALVEKWKELVKKADEVDEVQPPPKAPAKEVMFVPRTFFCNDPILPSRK